MITVDPPTGRPSWRPGGAALFLDRDGVINRDLGHVHRIKDFYFADGIFSLCRAAAARGLLLVVVTNQAGISKGQYSSEDFVELSMWMMARMADQNVQLAKVIGCPHHPEFPPIGAPHVCSCRKPAPGMILKAAYEFGIDLPSSFILGDKAIDSEAGRRAGVGTRLLLQRVDAAAKDQSDATHVVGSLGEAEALIKAGRCREPTQV